jgi:hypothetical protein
MQKSQMQVCRHNYVKLMMMMMVVVVVAVCFGCVDVCF